MYVAVVTPLFLKLNVIRRHLSFRQAITRTYKEIKALFNFLRKLKKKNLDPRVRGGMVKTNPTSAIPEVIKIEADQFHRASMERTKDLKMEMGILVRERDLLKKEVDLLDRTQKYTELEKCSMEEKLGRSEKRCEELEENLGRSERRCQELEAKIEKLRQKLNRSRRKCEVLRRKESVVESRNTETNQDVDELRVKKMDLEPTVKEEEENLNMPCFVEKGKVNANEGDRDAMPPEVFLISDDSSGHGGIECSKKAAEEDEETPNIPEFDENGKRKANAGDEDALSPEVCGDSDKSGGNIGIGLLAKGGRESVYCGTQRNGANVEFTHPGSKPSYVSHVAETESQGSVQVQDNEGKRPEVRGGRNLAYSGIEDEGENALTYPDSKRAYVSNMAENNGSNQDNEVDWPEHRGDTFRTFLQRRCHLSKIINDIKENLDEETLKKFEESCFGHLLKTNELTFQGQLIVQLLLHMDMSASNEKSLVFKINNSTMEFGPREFFHTTGLRLGKSETTITPYSSIQHSVFWGRPSIYLKDIEEAFLIISTSNGGKGELTLKLALLNFLYGTLLAKVNTTKIEIQYLHLIEDLQKFNEFPWGQLAYDYLVSSILEVRICMDTHRVGQMSINGFIDALQAWAYEMMPSVAAQCASCLNNFEKITPWILRWSATKIFKSKDLKKLLAVVDLKNTKGKKKEETIPEAEEANQKKRKFLCEGSDPVLHAQPSSAAMPPPPSMNAYPLHHCTRGLSLHKEFDEPVMNDDDLPRNEAPLLEVEEAMKEATSDPNPISINKATDNLERSLPVTERDGALSELANDNPVLDVPLLPWKEDRQFFELSDSEYERNKALHERLLNKTKRLKLWISYAKFEAFGMKEKSDFSEKRKCLERARAVFERGLSYFRTCAPELKEERASLLEEWHKIEKYFGTLGNADLVRAQLPQKLKKRAPIRNEDGTTGYVEHTEYRFPEEKTDATL